MSSGMVKKIKLEVCECGQFESFGDDKIRGMGEINEQDYERYQYSSISIMPSDIIFAQILDFMDFINVEDVRRFKNNMKNYPTDWDLRRFYYESKSWKHYKSNVLSDVISWKEAAKIVFKPPGKALVDSTALKASKLEMFEV